jgi:DNA-binding IclR family transcriptional regulator
VAGAGYTLGPAIVQMDRQIQLCDPMLGAARAVMNDLAAEAPPGAIILLCRLFHDRVICVHQTLAAGPQEPVSFERGRPMPLFRGATSKIILAHLPLRSLRTIFAANGDEISAARLGVDWEQFRRALAALRRDGVAITTGDIDPGRVGIAAPIFDTAEIVLGSLSYVLPETQTDAAALTRLALRIGEGARSIEEQMAAETAPPQSSPARLRVTG